jgi:eukaryotic-like serine/threonine-protein kinase
VTEAAGDVSVSDHGTIVYRPAQVSVSRLTWFDRAGHRTGTVGDPGPYDQLVLSPRGHHATVVRGDAQGEHWDLWDADLERGIFSRLTTHPADDSDPSWSPDERQLAFTSLREGRAKVFVKDLATGTEKLLFSFAEPVVVDQWTPNGQFVIFRTYGKAAYALPIGDDQTPRLLADTPFIEDEVHVSPSGRWVAFHADESGRWEVYLAEFLAFTSKRQISRDGGVQPQWRADGQELFFLRPDGSMMSVRVDTRAGLSVSAPSLLVTATIPADPFTPRYGVTADGQRFLGLERTAPSRSFTVLVNWLNRPLSRESDDPLAENHRH